MTIPFDPDAVWGRKERHYVRGTVNELTIRGRLDFRDGAYFLSLGAAWRRDRGIEAGSKVRVVLEAEGPQQTTLAPDLATALAAEPQAQQFFNSLATFYRNTYVKWIEGAKRPETRAKRIAEMIDLLKAGKKQKGE